MTKEKPASASLVETHQIVLPSHTNALGTIFGGTIMSWIDIAAAICAQKHSGRVCVTASVDALHFINPVRMGHMVKVTARVVYTGKSSMMISVRVTAQDLKQSNEIHCVDSLLTFVALDENGKPTTVPALQLTTPEEKAAHQKAAERRQTLLQLSK